MIRIIKEMTICDKIWMVLTYCYALAMMLFGLHVIALFAVGLLLVGSLSLVIVNRAEANRKEKENERECR